MPSSIMDLNTPENPEPCKAKPFSALKPISVVENR
jgi:hypothetical protein